MDKNYNEELKNLYINWLFELEIEWKEFSNDIYSNPYFISAPDNWNESAQRIMIVGEEGNGVWGCGKSENWNYDEIEKIQKFNHDYMQGQISDNENRYKKNNSNFWRFFREVANLGFPICWNNIDKIHILRNSNCKLKKTERKKLHSTQTKILSEEIKILKPTVVIFFGWYGISLQEELPTVFNKLYPNGLGDNSVWINNVVSINNGINLIFLYHPCSWWRKLKDLLNNTVKNEGYISYKDKALSVINDVLQKNNQNED